MQGVAIDVKHCTCSSSVATVVGERLLLTDWKSSI